MKPLQNITLGIVLPSIPGYSETFFRSKIAGLQENGADVLLYVLDSVKFQGEIPCKICQPPKLYGNKVLIVLTSVLELCKAFLFNFKVSCNYLALEKKDNIPFKKRFKSLIANNFILNQKLDWLHFGFGTMVLDRENVAEAIEAKMAVSFRGFDHYIYPIKNPNCYATLFSKKVKYHVLSEGMRITLENKGILKTEIKVITPAIDINLFKSSIEFNSSTLNIITVARLHWIKGLEYTLEALSILKSSGVEFNYTIIGDGSERERLIFAAYQLGLEKNVTFAGRLAPDEVKEQLLKATVYVQYSIQEGFCNAVIEAQAMGLLCIVSDADGLSENVLNNQTGWIVPKRNPKLLAEKIKEVVLMSEDYKKSISTKAMSRVIAEFNIEKQSQEFVNFYNK